MNILVAGSNQNGNDQFKDQAIAILGKAGHKTLSTKELFRSKANPLEGNRLVDAALIHCDLFYVACSSEGHIGEATTFRLGMASGLAKTICSSQAIASPDLHSYLADIVDFVGSPEELAAELDNFDTKKPIK